MLEAATSKVGGSVREKSFRVESKARGRERKLEKVRRRMENAHDPRENSALLAKATRSGRAFILERTCVEHVVLSRSEEDIDTEIIDSSSFLSCSEFFAHQNNSIFKINCLS